MEPDFSVIPSLVLFEPVIVAPDLSIESVMSCGISTGVLSEKLPLMVIFAGFCAVFSRAFWIVFNGLLSDPSFVSDPFVPSTTSCVFGAGLVTVTSVDGGG